MGRLADMFEKYDKDQTGSLNHEEVKTMLTEVGNGTEPTDQEMVFIMKMADTKPPEGKLGKTEFVDAINSWCCYQKEFCNEQSLGAVIFKKHDTDQSGHLDRAQLAALLKEMNGGIDVEEADVDFVLGKADVLCTGTITKIELSQAVACW